MKAIFPGSFDPISNGHLDIIEKAARLFDQVIVVISNNTHKNTLFSPIKRYKLVKDAVENWENVSVQLVQNDLTIKLVRELDADVIVRGIRNEKDFVYEQQIAYMNKKMDSSIETIILLSSLKNSCISSSLIREIASFNGNLSKFVPHNVDLALKKKYLKK